MLAYTQLEDPKGFYDYRNTNEKIDGSTLSDTKTERLYGAVLGYYYKFLGQNNRRRATRLNLTRDKVGQGRSREVPRASTCRVEQQAQIDGALSGI